MKESETRKYFTDKAHFPPEFSNSDKYVTLQELILPVEDHGRILECGGGSGFYTQRLLADGYAVTCVDITGAALEENSRKASSAGYAHALQTVEADFNSFCRKGDTRFDQVLFVKVLHHFESQNAIEMAIKGAMRRCRSGGRILIFEPNGLNFIWRIFLSLDHRTPDGKSKWHYEKNMKYTIQRILERMLENLLDTGEYSFSYRTRLHYVIPALVLNRIGWKWLRRLNSLLEDSLPGRLFSFNISVTIDMA